MPNMTVLIPAELKREMDAQDTINWSAVARHAFAQCLHDIEMLRQLKGTVKPRKHPPKHIPSDIFRAFGLHKIPEIRYVSSNDNLSAHLPRKDDVQRIGNVRRKGTR